MLSRDMIIDDNLGAAATKEDNNKMRIKGGTMSYEKTKKGLKI